MSELTKLERVELRLMDAAQKARREGKQIICGSYAVMNGRRIVACDPIIAVALSAGFRKPDGIRLHAIDLLGITLGERISLIAGFDGDAPDDHAPRPWFAMGRRLRRALNPVPLVEAS